MSARRAHERMAWAVVAAVLATSLSWMALASAAFLAGTCARCPADALPVARALVRALVACAHAAAPALVALLAAAGLVTTMLLRSTEPRPERVHHE